MKKAKNWLVPLLLVLVVVAVLGYAGYYARFQEIPLTKAVETEDWLEIRGGNIQDSAYADVDIGTLDIEAVKSLLSRYTVTRMGKKSNYSLPAITLNVYTEARRAPFYWIVTDTGMIMYSDGAGNGSPCYHTADTSLYDQLRSLLTEP